MPSNSHLAAAEENRHNAQIHLVHKTSREILLSSACSARDYDILVTRRAARLERTDSIPSVTNVNVVPPFISSGLRDA